MRRPCRLTASAFSVLGSKFITVPLLRRGLFLVSGIERLFCRFGLPLCANELVHDRHQGAGHEQQVKVEHAHEVEKCVEPWDDLPRFNGGNMGLRQAHSGSELPLTPAALASGFLYLLAKVRGQAFEPEGSYTFPYIKFHV